jgi:1-deoxy-D-xylulose-5-phosphate reductoisomerase
MIAAPPLRHPGLASAPRTVTILGATGSIGASTVDLLRRERGRFQVEAVTGGRNVAALAQLARDLNARFAAIADESCYQALKEALVGTGIEAGAGDTAVIEAAARPADLVVAAITGTAGLRPTLAAIERGATVALANKECLVCAGAPLMKLVRERNACLLPVDSEHNAIFQALAGSKRDDVERIILTASGGPFRSWPIEAIRKATLAEALRHPNWTMGRKITIDSATLMNKGLEIIEAHFLFDLAPAQIDVLVHPQSIVHGLVEYRDGSILAQLGPPDMRVPIAHCLAWPERLQSGPARLDFAKLSALTFEQPDLVRFPALKLARAALGSAGAPTVLNAANEVAVEAFLQGRTGFMDIPELVERTLEAASARGLMREPADVASALAVDHIARSLAEGLLLEIAAKAF